MRVGEEARRWPRGRRRRRSWPSAGRLWTLITWTRTSWSTSQLSRLWEDSPKDQALNTTSSPPVQGEGQRAVAAAHWAGGRQVWLQREAQTTEVWCESPHTWFTRIPSNSCKIRNPMTALIFKTNPAALKPSSGLNGYLINPCVSSQINQLLARVQDHQK